jgi:hypothetical protein
MVTRNHNLGRSHSSSSQDVTSRFARPSFIVCRRCPSAVSCSRATAILLRDFMPLMKKVNRMHASSVPQTIIAMSAITAYRPLPILRTNPSPESPADDRLCGACYSPR